MAPNGKSKVEVKLIGEEGNAFAVIGRCTEAMKLAGWTKAQIEEFRKVAMSGDYNHLLRTAMEYTADSEGLPCQCTHAENGSIMADAGCNICHGSGWDDDGRCPDGAAVAEEEAEEEAEREAEQDEAKRVADFKQAREDAQD
jgi:hypothetical protein